MPRTPRIQFPGALYHVTARGNRRQQIFLDDSDRERFLAVLSEVAREYSWRCQAYCLMRNHFHLLVETREPNLSVGMQRLNGVYAQSFNRRHGFTGHLFGGRFHSVFVATEPHLLQLARYVVLNPVRAGLSVHPGEWRWSSYRATAGIASPPRFLAARSLLRHFAEAPEDARAAFVAFVDDPGAAPASALPGHVQEA